MPRPRIKVYVVKHLSWHYNDECTIPGSADLEKCFLSRDKAELYRRELELEARDVPEEDGPIELHTRWPEERIRAWLAQFHLSEPPRDIGGRYEWDEEWLIWAEGVLGREGYLRFGEMFDRPYYYHVIETEMEV
jgi:hypothetical protein